MVTAEPVTCENNTKNAYIFGSLAVLIISLLSLVGAVIIPCLRTRSRHRWMQVFIALAAATMAGDALLHLIPEVLGVHDHGDAAACVSASEVAKKLGDEMNHDHDGHDHHKRAVRQIATGFEEFDPHEHGQHDHHEDEHEAHDDEHDEHEDDEHGHDGDDDHKMPLIRMSVVFAAVYCFYLFEMLSHGIAEQRKRNAMKRRIKDYTPNGGSPYSRNHRPQAVRANWAPIYDTPSQYYVTESDSGGSSVSRSIGNSHIPFASNHPAAAVRWNCGQHHYHPAGGPLPYRGPNLVALSDWWARTVPPPLPLAANPPAPVKEERQKPPVAPSGGHSHGEETWGADQPDLCCGFKPLALLILIGDAVHNFADGMAVGVTFAKSNVAGLSTSLAVICHELPHEIGDFAVLIDTGLPVWKALILNLVSALTAFAGLYVGIAVGEDSNARPWLFAVAAGMFLYVAWVDMMHHLKEYKSDDPWYVNLALQNVGLVLGFVLIFLLGWFEEGIKI